MIENPYTQPQYLTTYWCVKPALIDKDRTKRGDTMRKPTQYFFINFEPANNLILEPMIVSKPERVMYLKPGTGRSRAEQRSEITPEYANRFIREFLIKEDAQKIESQNASPNGEWCESTAPILTERMDYDTQR